MKNLPPEIQKRIKDIAGKLLLEGLTASTYTKAKAKAKAKNVVAPTYVAKMIDGFSPEIKKQMSLMNKK